MAAGSLHTVNEAAATHPVHVEAELTTATAPATSHGMLPASMPASTTTSTQGMLAPKREASLAKWARVGDEALQGQPYGSSVRVSQQRRGRRVEQAMPGHAPQTHPAGSFWPALCGF